MQVYSQISDRVCCSISKQSTGTPSESNHQWVLCQILNSRMSLKLQCWFYKSQIMFGKVKGSWSFTWKHRYSNSSYGLFFSSPAIDPVCLGWEREAWTCVDRVWLLGKSTYLEGEQCLTRNTASVSTWLIPRWASLHLCFVPTLDQRLMWRLAEVKCYQKLQPSYAGAENKNPARCMLEPRLLRRAGDTYQDSGE